MQKYLLIGFCLFLLPLVSAVTEIDGCEDDITSSGHYRINQSIYDSNVYVDCIDITADNVTLDGGMSNGYNITPNILGLSCVHVDGASNVTIHNLHCYNYDHVIQADDGEGLYFHDANGTGLTDRAFQFDSYKHVLGHDFIAHTDSWGMISLDGGGGSENLTFHSCSGLGVYANKESSFFTIYNCAFTEYFLANKPVHFTNLTNVSVNGMLIPATVFYWTGENSTYQNLDISNGTNLCLDPYSDTLYQDITVSHCPTGIKFLYDYNVTVDGFTSHSISPYYAISVGQGADDNTVKNFNINHSSSSATAVRLDNDPYNFILRDGYLSGNKTNPGGALETYYGIRIIGTDTAADDPQRTQIINVTGEYWDNIFRPYKHQSSYGVPVVDGLTATNTGWAIFLEATDDYLINDILCDNNINCVYVSEISGLPSFDSDDNTIENVHCEKDDSVNAYCVQTYGDSVERNFFYNVSAVNYGSLFYIQYSKHNEFNCGGRLSHLIGGSAAYGFLGNGPNNNFTGCHINNSAYGALLYYWDTKVEDVMVTHSWTGVKTAHANADRAVIRNVTLTHPTSPTLPAIDFQGRSTDNEISGSFINWTGGGEGVLLRGLAQVGSTGNTIEDSTIIVSGATEAIDTQKERADSQTIRNVTLIGDGTAGSYGIRADASDNSIINGTLIRGFATGISFLATGTGNQILNTYFCDNTLDASDADTNTWSGNSCNTTSGNAYCDTNVSKTCPSPSVPSPVSFNPCAWGGVTNQAVTLMLFVLDLYWVCPA